MREKREFNFAYRWEKELARAAQKPGPQRAQILAWLVGGMLVLGILIGGPFAWEYKLERDLVRVEAQIAAMGNIEADVQKTALLKGQIQTQQQILSIQQRSTRDPGPVLAKLSGLLPPGTVINSFSLNGDSLALNITAPMPVDVANLWANLRASGMFQDVNIQTVSLQDKAQTLSLNLKMIQP